MQVNERPGYDALWEWFGLSRARWLTLPRVLMHEMPDDWQRRMAELLTEWNEAWNSENMPMPYVVARQKNHFARWPEWLLNYRYPDKEQIERMRSRSEERHAL